MVATQLNMFVLDVLKYDVEPLSSILEMLNSRSCIGWRAFWPHDFRKDEVVRALHDLYREKMIRAVVYDEEEGALVDAREPGIDIVQEAENLWFALSEKGRKALAEWDPPVEEDEADAGSGDEHSESSGQ